MRTERSGGPFQLDVRGDCPETIKALSNEDAGAPEIDVTPAMIDAGASCFYDLPELLGPSEEQLRESLRSRF